MEKGYEDDEIEELLSYIDGQFSAFPCPLAPSLSSSYLLAFCLATKPSFLSLFPLFPTNTLPMRIHLHAHKYAYVHGSTPAHCNHVIYSPLEVDDFRYFSSAVSSKQLPFLTPAPATGSSYTFQRGYPRNGGHEPFRYPEDSLRSWTKVKVDVYVIEIVIFLKGAKRMDHQLFVKANLVLKLQNKLIHIQFTSTAVNFIMPDQTMIEYPSPPRLIL